MSARRLLRTPFCWIASLAILLAALAPVISQAVATGGQAGWTEICTEMGARMVRLDDGAPVDPAGARDQHPFEHCPYCALQGSLLGLPPAGASGLTPAPQRFALPELFLVAPRTLHAWAGAQPRGPPRQA